MPLPSIFWVLCFCACQFLYGQGKLYWTDWGTQTVQSANLDGTNVTDLVTGLSSAKGDVALDLQNNKIYWIDRGTGFLQKANLDGSGWKLLLWNWFGWGGLDLDVANGHVYYGDYTNNNIKRATGWFWCCHGLSA